MFCRAGAASGLAVGTAISDPYDERTTVPPGFSGALRCVRRGSSPARSRSRARAAAGQPAAQATSPAVARASSDRSCSPSERGG